ncbi:MAG TPA: D-tyrosyl-tRNA(Tyr) deacylase [Cryomorphaceae bacterium]|nr:D-tyrosyl-tRNA(Tyr) deacylase [Cryomorphaceae bacterium]HBB80434.1 D-tyrosyl-tRNA(Tyr) deacylase [Cryomorphaceae bacterium]HCY25759.1 D-tyrosyl-tRNA(Tyr) deacylase [Cryomorphaceae bacterium]|tara:strand:- start:7 stop:459 length:453 start_codon:yes stop_codon:yes gene_type:complete
MRALLQRVSQASVAVKGNVLGEISKGLVVLLGIGSEDTQEDANWLCRKISNMRLFPDEDLVMNLDIMQAHGAFLVVSQFTLQASTQKGNRPSYIKAARPAEAEPLYEYFKDRLRSESRRDLQSGKFGSDMQVQLINDGPVTIWIDSKNRE